MAEKKEIILCLDIGTKRIGVAKSDVLGMMAHALPMIARKSDEHAVQEIMNLVENEHVERIVIGLPRNMDGTLGPAAEMVQAFGSKVKEAISIPVEFWDERLSSVQAERFLIEKIDMSRAKRKEKIDSLAAQMVLESYMSAKGR